MDSVGFLKRYQKNNWSEIPKKKGYKQAFDLYLRVKCRKSCLLPMLGLQSTTCADITFFVNPLVQQKSVNYSRYCCSKP